MSLNSVNLKINFRIWFYKDTNKLLGKGRIELLELIQKTGSISKAAKVMEMSYRQAWQMVEEMNERAESPLVEKQLGGKSGGGATLTILGRKYIKAFHEMNLKVEKFITKELKKLKV